MIYLFCYDFPSSREGDRRRAKLARRLEGLGLRVQYSVFELELDPEKLPDILTMFGDLIHSEQDSLRVYPLCATCNGKRVRLGVDAPCEHGALLVW
jgi:CRISPR-associated protein Cas2